MKSFFLMLLGAALLAAAAFGGYKLGFKNGAVFGAAQNVAAIIFQLGYNAGLNAERV